MGDWYTIEVFPAGERWRWVLLAPGEHAQADGFATNERTARDCAELVKARLEGRRARTVQLAALVALLARTPR